MSGTGAAIHRIFQDRERKSLTAERTAALAALAARARELNEAVVHTDLADEELAEIGALLQTLTDRLNGARLEDPPYAGAPAEDGMFRQLAGPVTGRLNPISPPCEVERLPDDSVRTEFTLNALYEGPPGLVHGGVSAMVLDQILGMAAEAGGSPGLTASLELRYRRPTPHGEPLVAEACLDRVEGRRTYATGRIRDAEGKVTVEATAMFITPAR